MYIKGLVNTKDQSNACVCEMMSKGLKEALTVLIDTHVTQVERVERFCYVETRDIHIFAHNFLNIQPIFNPKKSFGKLRPFQPYHPMLCMLKHVEGVKSRNNFQPFWPLQLSKTFFRLKIG